MALNIKLGANVSDGKSESSSVHSIPCKIDYDGPAKVDEFFTTYIDQKTLINGEEVQEASFRGYPLHGKEVKLPPGYVGFIASETKKPLSESGQRTATITQKFDSFTYWNWDCTTSNSDPYQKIEDWATLSEVIHSD